MTKRIFDAGDDLHGAAADTADFDVDIEHTLQALRPAHRCPALNRHGCFWPGCCGLMTSATPSRRHQRSVLTVEREHAVISRQIHPRFWHQDCQPGDEVQGLKNEMGCAISIANLRCHLTRAPVAVLRYAQRDCAGVGTGWATADDIKSETGHGMRENTKD